MRIVKQLVACLLLAAAMQNVHGFSLLGPFNSFEQDAVLQYSVGGRIGGPMNYAEEYRWNEPIIIYSFDPTFLNYFGQDGVNAVESAIKVFQDLPAFSTMSADLHEYPLNTARINYRAAALNLVDIKSVTMRAILEELGVTSAEDFVWCLSAHYDPPLAGVHVIMRNYDPVTWDYSPYVNGTLYTYHAYHYVPPATHLADAVEDLVDPLARANTSVSSYLKSWSSGLYYTGLTRDDVGALRYIYRKGNYNIEALATNITATYGGAWTPYNTNLTNIVYTTNDVRNPVGNQLRQGIDKITFQRVNMDSMYGNNFTKPITNYFSGYYITNGVLIEKRYQKVNTGPDLIFSGSSIVFASGSGGGYARSTSSNWVNNASVNSYFSGGNVLLDGPGVIHGMINITYSMLGPGYDTPNLYFMSDTNNIYKDSWWSSYDGSTNAPTIYPNQKSVLQIESQLLQSQSQNPWVPSYASTNNASTNATSEGTNP